MKQKEHITAFYLETLLLIMVFVGIILVLTQIFGLARTRSSDAKDKTSAVCLCQNAAESFSAASSRKELLSLLNEKDNARETGENMLECRYDKTMHPDPQGDLAVTIHWDIRGKMRYGTIETKEADRTIYSLDTAVCDGEEWQ